MVCVCFSTPDCCSTCYTAHVSRFAVIRSRASYKSTWSHPPCCTWLCRHFSSFSSVSTSLMYCPASMVSGRTLSSPLLVSTHNELVHASIPYCALSPSSLSLSLSLPPSLSNVCRSNQVYHQEKWFIQTKLHYLSYCKFWKNLFNFVQLVQYKIECTNKLFAYSTKIFHKKLFHKNI